LSTIFFILRRIQKDFVANTHKSSRKEPIILSQFHEISFLSTDFRKTIKHQFFFLNSSNGSGVDSGRTERQTDMTILIAAFHNCSNAPKDYILCNFLLGCFLQLSLTTSSVVMPIFRANISQQKPKFSFRVFRMDFAMEKVTLQQDFSRKL